jgi:hypothetical protein
MLYRLFSIPLVSRTVGILIMAGMFAFCQSDNTSEKNATVTSTQENKTLEKKSQRERKLIVYYFHTNFRCHSCITIEKLTRQAVNEGFADQLKNGRIEFKEINVEEAGNEHFVDDYKLYTKSVILSDVKDGKETSWKNCEKVWPLLGNEQKFIDYIQTEVKALL